ncbi:hypothetical protein CKG00_15015 (plasmid) [Morganella morganii]|uniref:Uncharacterized protein n=1 Tax=Morganella morganii TaxID=582 RepID=A0A433ZS29_MORMO|nr:hypothetical protein [Morganella morganii]RUT64930.1 hypothetical protein CKG00_15015 [Morganella morganii]
MHTQLPNVLNVKTALDAFHFLCLVEGKLMSIQACQRLGLGLEREEPTELNAVECAVIDAGEAFGGERAISLLATVCHTDCKRAKPADREDYLALFERLKQRVDTVNPKGALRYPAF